MKKYAVFKKTEFVPTHELSLSNKIVEKEPVSKVLEIVNEWARKIYPDANICYKGFKPNIADLFITRVNTIGDNTGIVVFNKESNVRFRIGFFNTIYETREVK